MISPAVSSAGALPPPRVLIVAEHASARFGGEAALPLHYFRVLRARGIDVWLITHARTRTELAELFKGEPRIHYVEDTWLHVLMYRLGTKLPAQIAYFTTGFVSRLSVQLEQRRIVKRLVATERVEVVHQPMPVSPREPSMMYGFGVPVLIGPMNGGMDYPPRFKRHRGALERALLGAGRRSAAFLNRLMPGKRQAATLLVANERTRRALPAGLSPHVVELVENGVDLTLWRPAAEAPAQLPAGAAVVTFIFMGRLVDWKAVDLLIEAFGRAQALVPMRLLVIGDGHERAALEALARQRGVLATEAGAAGKVSFMGWLPQATCAEHMRHADGLVLPSLLECGGAVVLEAMSMGKAVIATAWGGPLDYLDEHCGVLVPPTDRDALVAGFAEAMARLAADRGAMAEMGARGREKVLREFDWEVKVDQVLSLYDAARLAPLSPVAARP